MYSLNSAGHMFKVVSAHLVWVYLEAGWRSATIMFLGEASCLHVLMLRVLSKGRHVFWRWCTPSLIQFSTVNCVMTCIDIVCCDLNCLNVGPCHIKALVLGPYSCWFQWKRFKYLPMKFWGHFLTIDLSNGQKFIDCFSLKPTAAS